MLSHPSQLAIKNSKVRNINAYSLKILLPQFKEECLYSIQNMMKSLSKME